MGYFFAFCRMKMPNSVKVYTMKLSTAQIGNPHRIITDERILRRCVFHLPFKRSNISLLMMETGKIITLQIEYKHVALVITYTCDSIAEGMEFVDKMLDRCPTHLSKDNTLTFTKLLMENSVPAFIEPKVRTTRRINSPLEFDNNFG